MAARAEVTARLHCTKTPNRQSTAMAISFTATRIAQKDYGLEHISRKLHEAAARLARAAADEFEAKEPGRPRYVGGSMGPTNRTASISPDVNDPAARNVTFDELAEAYGE